LLIEVARTTRRDGSGKRGEASDVDGARLFAAADTVLGRQSVEAALGRVGVEADLARLDVSDEGLVPLRLARVPRQGEAGREIRILLARDLAAALGVVQPGRVVLDSLATLATLATTSPEGSYQEESAGDVAHAGMLRATAGEREPARAAESGKARAPPARRGQPTARRWGRRRS
jgi:hypothetical protein